MSEIRVSVPLDEYNELVRESQTLYTLLALVYDEVSLNYRKDDLRLDSDTVLSYIKAIDGERYGRILKHLLNEEQKRIEALSTDTKEDEE